MVAADAPATRPELAMQVRQVQGELFAVGAAAQLQSRPFSPIFSSRVAHDEFHACAVAR